MLINLQWGLSNWTLVQVWIAEHEGVLVSGHKSPDTETPVLYIVIKNNKALQWNVPYRGYKL